MPIVSNVTRRIRIHAKLALGSIGVASVSAMMVTMPSSVCASSLQQNRTAFLYGQVASRYDSTWQRIASGFALDHRLDDPRVQQWLGWFEARPQMFDQFARRAAPWLRYVAEQVDDRGMPGELALLPFIESGYDPTARNPGGSSGLWQFMPATAREMGLDSTRGYAGRRDVVASTGAALDYFEMLRRHWYGDDWELTLAAYNAGPGRVNAALASSPEDDFWGLALPRETRDYVPKLLALSAIVSDPRRYGIDLPPIPDQPTFVQVDLEQSLDIRTAAELAGIELDELRALNPAYSGTLVQRGLLIPVDAHRTFDTNLAEFDFDAQPQRYIVGRGDTLSEISARTGISIEEIKRRNRLADNQLRVGQALMLAGG
ncbi:transglycosylase SLT domain-containing protein [Halotalea alkalilenta]|uniref:LysM domain-containing protein n=1 Tax=Halotalea alkalilenta TaxID=376489 RepID=A0A172YG91_9GAMM|nr:transglycosylase SLT domain-containing protein [Halotalea alkalilenta]ANF58082.1 hypothetical protein A5892_11905 [Halotalea alkalilenta]